MFCTGFGMTECYSIGNFTEPSTEEKEGEQCMVEVCFTAELLTDNNRILCFDDGCLLVSETEYLDGFFSNSSIFWYETTAWEPLSVVPLDTPADIEASWDNV